MVEKAAQLLFTAGAKHIQLLGSAQHAVGIDYSSESQPGWTNAVYKQWTGHVTSST